VLLLIVSACSSGEPAATLETSTDSSRAGVWSPPPGTTWQWQLTGEIDTSYDVEMYDVDLFDTPIETIVLLQEKGRIVICYLSAGSFEDWRADSGRFPPDVIGESLDAWPGERWLDIHEIEAVAPVLESRLDLAVAKGCDGVEPDNVDGHLSSTGFDISGGDQLVFNRWLADEAHARGLSIGLKNDLSQVGDLVDWFDWILVEECVEFDECSGVEPFLAAGKAAFGAEYTEPADRACGVAAEFGISLLFKDLELGATTTACP